MWPGGIAHELPQNLAVKLYQFCLESIGYTGGSMLMWFVIYSPLPICYVRVCVGGGWCCCCKLDNMSFILIFTVPK